MKDAFGGIVNIVLVAIFLVIISGILGLGVNYTKAFRMKNAIISAIEQYEGASGCFTDAKSGCQTLILKKASELGYSQTALNCSTNDRFNKDVSNLFCYRRDDSIKEDNSKLKNNYTYTIITQVNIDIPIINNMMGLSIFQVHGDTRPLSIWKN